LTPSRLVAGLAVAVLLPMAITLVLNRTDEPLEFLPGTWYLAAVMLAAALGGLAAGSLCVVLSALGFWWAVLTPRQSFDLTAEQGVTLLSFLVIATIVEWVVHRLERAYSAMESTSLRLEEADARFRQVVELGGIGVVSGEGDVVVEANDAFLHLVGRSSAEVDAGDLRWSAVAPDAHPTAVSTRVAPPREQVLTHADGRDLPALVSTVVVDPDRWRWSSFVVDLSERKSIEHRLRASELRHRSLVNATSSIVWTTSPRGEFVTPQPDWEAYTGHPWERHRGSGWLDAVHPDDRARTIATWQDCVEREVPYEVGYRLWHESTGTYRQVEAHAAPVLDEHGEAHEWIGTIVDVHDQRLAEAEAQALAIEVQAREAAARATARLAEQLEAAQRIAHMGSWEWSADDGTVTWSREMFRIFDLPENPELRGPDDLDLHIHPDDRLPRSRARAEAVEQKKPFTYEKRVLRPGGDIRTTVVSGEPILDDEGRVLGLRGTVHDVTEQREAQAQLDRAREDLLRSELSRLHEHELVRAMQEVALPATLPDVDGLEIAATYVPAEGDVEIGGDWYDAFVLDDGQVVVTVGDVSGHGVGAAAVMAHLRNGLRAYAYEGLDPPTVLARLNRLLYRYDTDSFATAVVGFYDPADRRLRWSQAGHPPPILFGPGQTSLLTRPGCGGTVLGVWPDATYEGCATALPAGSGVLLYTDGLVERRGETIDRGLDRLRHALDGHEAEGRPLPSLLDHLARTLIHEGGRDDTCQLAIRSVPSASC
jgi:PAS domain S-box-containing protein